jgi:uncharacterized protein YndB with AHSA1/START domain
MTAAQEAPRTISFTFDLPHPPEKVWRALTDPALVSKWLMATDIGAERGRKFTFKSQPTPWWNGVVDCEVLEVERNQRLRYTWRAPPLDTVVTWTLTKTASGTRLALEHQGFPVEPASAYEGAKYGWQKMVAAMEKLLAG